MIIKISNSFNNYFTTIADKLLTSKKYMDNKHFSDYLQHPKEGRTKSFHIKPTDQIEIESLISLTNIKKSNGPNSIPNQIIKSISSSISLPISNICNKSFITSIFPDKLKMSKVIPIHKKVSKLKVANYRPISLLSNIDKIMEKIMFSRMHNFFELHNYIYHLQFGFRAKHSMNHALMSITQRIREAIDNGNMAIGVFVDLQKAFDTVNHDILLYKINHYGIRGMANDWFRSYLKNRSQYVFINGFDSILNRVDHGVPQGSVLGPLLFLIYINDLNICIANSEVYHFADDTHLLHISKKKLRNRNVVKRINTDLKRLNNWLLPNKISLNASKTEIIYFRKKGYKIPEVTVKMNGVKLTSSTEIKYLGILTR